VRRLAGTELAVVFGGARWSKRRRPSGQGIGPMRRRLFTSGPRAVRASSRCPVRRLAGAELAVVFGGARRVATALSVRPGMAPVRCERLAVAVRAAPGRCRAGRGLMRGK